jgi:hypothetical protein
MKLGSVQPDGGNRLFNIYFDFDFALEGVFCWIERKRCLVTGRSYGVGKAQFRRLRGGAKTEEAPRDECAGKSFLDR